MFDIIYITWFSQIMSAFVSPKFWYTYLLVRMQLNRYMLYDI